MRRALVVAAVMFTAMGTSSCRKHGLGGGGERPKLAPEIAAVQRHTITLLGKGRALLLGGSFVLLSPEYRHSGALTTAHELDRAGDHWAPQASMGSAREEHTATLLADGTVLVAGGRTGANAIASWERYDPVSARWVEEGQMSRARSGHAAVRLPSGEVLVFGGSDPESRGPLTSVERYVPAEHRWKTAADLHQQHACLAAALLRDGRVLVAGGCDVHDGTASAIAGVELYDPVADRWTEAGPLIEGRSDATATVMSDGRVLIAGGAAGSGQGMRPTASTEIFDPSSGRFTSGPPLSKPRSNHRALELRDGRVLLVGGRAGPAASDYATMVELYDPRAARWTSAPPPSRACLAHTATALPDGRVLLLGCHGSPLLYSPPPA